jgi:hypothetical protein
MHVEHAATLSYASGRAASHSCAHGTGGYSLLGMRTRACTHSSEPVKCGYLLFCT